MTSLAGKTLFITGGSRGIGAAIARRAGRDGANVVIAAKTNTPHPKLPGTIHSVAEDVDAAGGRGLGLAVDIRDADRVAEAMREAADRFGGIDILVNNASAIWLAGIEETPIKRLDLMLEVNARGSFVCAQAALPYLKKAANPHILTLAPPPSLDPRWWGPHVGYTLAKMGMSHITLGLAFELKRYGIGVNGLWPRSVVATEALNMLPGVDISRTRKPEIVADAAREILIRDAKTTTGNFFIDDAVLAKAGVTDFDVYATQPGRDLMLDLFLDPEMDGFA